MDTVLGDVKNVAHRLISVVESITSTYPDCNYVDAVKNMLETAADAIGTYEDALKVNEGNAAQWLDMQLTNGQAKCLGDAIQLASDIGAANDAHNKGADWNELSAHVAKILTDCDNVSQDCVPN